MGILDNLGITINPTKAENKPTLRGDFSIDKKKPISVRNAPLYNYTEWKAFGFIKDAAGIPRPRWITKVLPMGHAFVPDLDIVKSCKGTPFGSMVSPGMEEKFIPPIPEKHR